MGPKSTYALLLTLTFCIQPAFTQSVIPVNLDKQRQRTPIDVVAGANHIQVCGLRPGTTYSVVAVGAHPGQVVSFQLHLKDAELEAAALPLSRPDRPQHRKFVATEECADLDLWVESPEKSASLPISLSVGCTDCPEANEFLEKFVKNLEDMGMANLSVTGNISASSLITNTLIGGDCFDIGAITSTGPGNSRGTFTNGGNNIGIANGMVLCTGNVTSLPGPNTAGNTSANTAGFNQNSADDPDLATLTNGNQFDVIKIEFDFTPTATDVQFDYVFGSEEYCEYVNSNYNDVFGFFISGPGFSGPTNLAIVPTTNDPVTINNVNHLTNTAYYVNNNTYNPCQAVGACCTPECSLDGWTTVLTATASDLTPCSTYHIKLAIADIADGLLFSAVFLKANSFDAGGVVKAQPVYPSGFNYVIEGCDDGFIRFIRAGGDINVPLTINFTVGGTATPGDDYDPLSNSVTIPAGSTEILIPVNVFADFIVEGQETIIIMLDNPCSCATSEFTFYIDDKPPLEIELEDQEICGSSGATLSPDITGPGLPPYTYLWSTNATTPSITVNTPGTNTYTVTVTDDCGTTATAEATVTIEPNPTASLTGSGVFCAGNNTPVDLTITLTGIGPWEVEINNNGTNETYTYTSSPAIFTVTEPGTYSLTSVSTSNGCPGTATGSVTITEITVDLSLSPTDPLCFGANNGTIQATASGGTGPFTYAWSPSGTGPNQSNLGPGTYTVTATNSQGCSAEESVTLSEPPLLTASVNSSTNIDCYTPTGSADLEVGGGTPGYNYNWSNGFNGEDPTFTAGGTYTVTVADGNNCSVTATVSITANTTPPTAVAVAPPPLTCTTTEVTINGTGSSQGPPYSYEWSGPGITCCETTLEPLVNAPGTYTLTVTNSDNGCTNTVAVTVAENITPPNVNINTPQNIGCNLPVVTLDGTGTSNGPGFTFTWSTNGGNFVCCTNTLMPQIDQAGEYNLFVTNANNGCTAEATVTVIGNIDPPTAVVAPPGIVDCNNPELELDGSGSSSGSNFTYQWGTTGGNFTGGQNTSNPTIDQGGTYTITVTNTDNNCTATASVVVTTNLTPPVAVATAPPPLTCTTTEVTINGTGSSQGSQFTYEWDGPGITCCGTTLEPQVNAPGTYTLTVTNSDNGCTNTVAVTVTENITPPNVNINTPQNIGCNLPVVTLNGTGTSNGPGFTFTWSTNGGNFVCCTNTLMPQVNQAGEYTLFVTNANNGCTAEETVTVVGNIDPPTAIIAPPAVVDCNNPELELDGSGSSSGNNFTYQWGTAGGNFTGGQNTTNPTIDQGGTYTITVTNSDNNCTATASVVVTANLTPPVAVATATGILTCQNPTLTINGNGSSTGPNFTYEWTTVNGNFVSGETTLTPVVNQGGSYTLVVTNNDNGCTSSVTVNVNDNQDSPLANAGPPLELNCNQPTLQLQGSGSSGPNFTTQWTANPGFIVSGANTFSPTINEAGTYTLVVTNTANGCTTEDLVTITSNFDTPTAIIAPPATINCYSPEIDLDAGGSTQGGNIGFNWTTTNGNIVSGATTPNPTVNQPGTYNLVVTNTDSGCTATSSVTVTANLTPPAAVANAPGIITCTNPTLVINGNGSSTGNNFTYEWTTNNGEIISGETTLNPVVGMAGTYTLLVTNLVNGCTNTASVNVTANQTYPVASAGPALLLNCTNPTLQLQGSGTSGSGINIQWTANPGFIVSGANTYTPTVNQAGVYFLVVTNTTNGCTTEDFVEVNANFDQPVALIAPPGSIDCYSPQIDLDAGASTQGGNINFTWTTPNGNFVSGQNSPYPTVNQAGTYNLVVLDTDSGCSATASVQVTANLTPPLANAGPGATLNCTQAQITLNGSGSQGSNINYEWFTSNGNIVSGENTLTPVVDQAGNYSLTVTNLTNGCTASSSVTILADQNAPLSFAGGDDELTCANMSLSLSASGSSTGNGITYQWIANPGNIVSGANTMSPVVDAYGYYTLIVTNTTNGCTDEDEVFVDDNIIYPTASISPAQQLNCTYSSVQLDAGASSQGNNFDYIWTTTNGNIVSGNGTPYPEVDQVGTYNLVVVNTDNACEASASITVTSDYTLPTATAVPTASITCQNPQTTLNGQGSSSGYPYFYEWTTANGNIVSGHLTLNPTVNMVGTYTLTVFDVENGCTAQTNVQVTSSQTFPTADAGPAQTITCIASQLNLDGTGSSQGQQYNYVWTTQNGNIVSGANTLNPLVNAPGTYELSVINTQTGCTSAASVLVDQNTVNPQAMVAPGGVLSCTVSTLTLNGTGSSAGPNFTYNWTTVAGNIVSGQTTLNPVVSATGNYTLIVTNTTNGCTATNSTTVSADASIPTANAGPPDTLNCLVSSLVLDGSSSSQGSQFGYAWSGPGIVSGGTTLTPTVNLPGMYVLLITNNTNGCTASSNVNIPADQVDPIAEAGLAAVLNCINTQLTLNGTTSSTGPQMVYAWTSSPGGNILSGANTLMPQIDQPGTYTLLVTNNSNGCTSTDLVDISENTVLPTANAGAPGLITCTATTVTLSGSGSTGPAFVYAWTTADGSIATGATTLSPIVDAPGTYNLLVTDTLNGCTATASVLVNKDANVPTAIVQAPNVLTCAITQIQLNGNGSTSGAGIQYNWTTTNGNILSGVNTLTPQIDAPGQYTLTVFNTNNNCEALFSVNVVQNLTPPVASAGSPAVLSCSNPVLTLNGSGSSQGAQYSYQWTTVNGNIVSGATTIAPQIDRSGNYQLVVTNTQNGCTASSSVQILLDQNSPQAEAGPGMALTCVASQVTLNGAGTSTGPNFVYQWTTSGGGNIVSGATSLSPVVNASGTYTLLVTNPTNGCTSTDFANVVVDMALPVAVIAPPATLNCQVVQTTLNTGGSSTGSQFTYKWTTVGGNILSGTNSPAPVVNKPGTYNLVLTNTTNGCTTTASAVVLQDITLPTASAGPTSELNCVTSSLNLAGTAGNVGANVQYGWTTANGNILSGGNTLTPLINAPGVYVLTVTNMDNFCVASNQVAISQNVNLPTVATAAAPLLTCAVPAVSLNGNGSSSGAQFSYQWVAQGGGNILSGGTTLLPSVNAPGLYILTVTNNTNKCTSTASVTVDQNIVAPTAVAGNTITLTCTTPSLQLNGTGSSTGADFVYQWSTQNGQILSGENTLQPTIGAAGLYSLVVSNQFNGCTKTASVQVLQDANAPVAVATAPSELTCNTTALTLSGAGSSVGSNFGYQWSTTNGSIQSGATTLSPVVSEPGTYNLLVSNSANGCTVSESVVVTENVTPPTVDAGTSGTITCTVTQLNLSGTASGGAQGVGYSWTTTNGNIISGANTNNPQINAGGAYTLTVFDLYNGCSNTDQVLVPTDTQAPPIAIATPGLLTCVVAQVPIDATASAQGSQFSYVWNGPGILSGNTGLQPQVNQPGTYQLLISNNLNGCTASATTNVIQNITAPLAEAGSGFELTCSVEEGLLSANGSSTGVQFNYLWSTTNGNILSAPNVLAPSVNAPGTYNLLVTNTQTGCTATDLVLVTENTNYPSDLELFTDPPGCGGKMGTIRFVEVLGGIGPYLYSINGGDTYLTVNEFQNLSPGQYQLVIQDANGCEYEEVLNFPVPVEPIISLNPEITLAYGESATLTALLNIPIYLVDTIIWSPMESLTLTNKPNVVIAQPYTSTEYQVRVVNLEGCEDRATVIVRVDDPNLWAPNVISPHREDGKNDVFLIFAGQNTVNKINSLQIYDRWGNQVFRKENIQPNDEKQGWNGRFRGQPMNPAVFVWWAEVELASGQKIVMKGDVTIVN